MAGIITGNKVFIDKQFIKVFNHDQIVLNINPVTSLLGLAVYDASGRKLGKVRKLHRDDNKNDFKAITVKNRFYHKKIIVDKHKIDIMKKNVILNIDHEKEQSDIKRKVELSKRRKAAAKKKQ